MILTAMIANRTVSFALFEAGVDAKAAHPKVTFSIAARPMRTADEYAALISLMMRQKAPDVTVESTIVASVVPTLTGEICEALRALFANAACLTVGAGLKTGLTIRTDAPALLGADLVAMAVGGLAVQKPPFLVLCCGDMTTLSAVGAGKDAPSFLGCSILPGAAISAEALNMNAALLSTVGLSHPVSAIGTNTEDSVRSGVLLGHAAAIEGLIARFERELGVKDIPVIVTGEEAALLAPLLDRKTLCDEELVYRGLYALTQLNARKIENFRKRYQ